MILGITGGMGCGKTTAAKLFEKRGYRRVDSDALVREKVLPSTDVIAALQARHGNRILGADGEVNRAALAEIVFADDLELRWLEELIHPKVFAIWSSFVERKEHSSAGPNVIVEIPLLFEKSLEKWFDFVVCVACSPEQQFSRLEQRGLNRAFAGQRISKQLPLTRKIESSDFVLWNEGTVESLQAQVDRLVDSLAQRAAQFP